MEGSFLSLPAKRSIVYTAAGMSDPNPAPINGSFKKSKPQHPLSVPSGHVAFRMLCHESRIGGVIGKSGQVIKQLQQVTGAKIRIEDAPSDSPDRVVTVIAPTALTSKLSLHQNSGVISVNGEEIEVSKAQEALLMVFDRILAVAAERDGVNIGVGIVSCRLLAEVAQAGSVIGKGGKVVEKIRKESGCRIRVFTDKLPACAGPSDEMIEIEGDVFSIKKALVAISRRLQDCTPVDTRMIASGRPPEALAHETLPDLRVDHLLQRNPALSDIPTSSSNFASGVRPFSIDANRVVLPVDMKTLQQEVVFKILCTNERVGGVIGKGGTIVKALQNESGATISVGASIPECDERLITVTASENPELRYSPAQKAVVLVFSRFIEAGIEKGLDSGSKGSPTSARLVVPGNQVGCLLGKGGTIISEMRKATSTGIRILGREQIPKCASETDEVVQISGEFSNVQDALYNVTGRLRDNLFSSLLSNSGTRNNSSVLTDTSPYGRLRECAAPGVYPTPSSGVPHIFPRNSNLTQSMDHLGLSHSLERPSSPGFWPPSSPGLWPPHTLTGVNSRGIPDARGMLFKGGRELGSGSKSAIVTNTTVEIVVPENVIGCVYGENGSNLARLKQISGAKVTVHEPRPGTSDRIVVISGTPDETQAAQSLLHAFILTGQS